MVGIILSIVGMYMIWLWLKWVETLSWLQRLVWFITLHTVQKLRVISNKCPKTFNSFFSLHGIGTYIKTLW